MMARKYQRGNLTQKPRVNGPDVWEFRWRDVSGRQRSKLLGTIEQYPTVREAQSAADAVRLEVNSESQRVIHVTVAALTDRYLANEVEMSRLAYATRLSYKAYLNNWIKPKWGSYTLE
jgi:integrase